MSQAYLRSVFGTDAFHDFGKIGAGLRVVYPVTTGEFPIGYINDPNGKAGDDCRRVIDSRLGNAHGAILHLALAPHKEHNVVGVFPDGLFPDGLAKTGKFVGDGLIVRRTGMPFVLDTFLGDCALIVVWNDEWIGYMHVGWPELIQEPLNVIQNLFAHWNKDMSSENDRVWMGPCITELHFERETIPPLLQSCAGVTAHNTQGFKLDQAIIRAISCYGQLPISEITNVGIDPYAAREAGDRNFASNEWAKRKSAAYGFPVSNVRNAAMLFVDDTVIESWPHLI